MSTRTALLLLIVLLFGSVGAGLVDAARPARLQSIEASQRATARMLGVDHKTIAHDLDDGGEKSPRSIGNKSTNTEREPANDHIGENSPPAADTPVDAGWTGATADPTREAKRVTRNAERVWTNADLEHPTHRPSTPDPHLDEILARLAARQYVWYPSPADYGGPVAIAPAPRPAWQNDPWDWPTSPADRTNAPYPTDVFVPVFGCWGCGPIFRGRGRIRELRSAPLRHDRGRR